MTPLKKIAFFDRDGVINKKAPEHEYITKKENFFFNEKVFEIMSGLRDQGFEFIIITNQRGIARGLMTHDDLNQIHDHMISGLKEKKINILDIFHCPHNSRECNCRKPLPGMLEEAVKKHEIDLKESVLISDSELDIEMGRNFGIGKCVLVESDSLVHKDI